MQRRARCRDTSSVASHHRVNPVVIDIAVENFPPRSRKRESDAVVVPSILGERGDYNDVLPSTLQPSVKRNDAVLFVDVERIEVLPA